MTGNDTPLVRVRLLGKFLVEQLKADGTWKPVPNSAWATTYARLLLKRLLPATGRRAARIDLLDDLWPNNDGDNVSDEELEEREKRREKYLSDAASKLRQILGKEIIQPLGSHTTGSYQLAGQSVLWSDIEECERLIAEAERLGLSSADAFPLLEKISEYFKRGSMLEGEDGSWCLAFRAQQEEAMKQCLLSLAEGYEARKMLWSARKQYQWLLEMNPIDEDALHHLMGLLHRSGLVYSLRVAYKEAQQRFRKYEMSLSQTTKKLFEHLMQEPPPFALFLTPPTMRSRPSESETSLQSETALAQASTMTYNVSGLPSSLPCLEKLVMLMLSRRQALHNVITVAGASIMLSPYALLPQESQEHLELMMTHSSYVDKEALDHLAAITQRFWGLREKMAPIDLLSGVTGHLTTITQLFQESRPTDIWEKLCALASETAQLLGTILYEIREYSLAWYYYIFSQKMSQEIHHTDLWASGSGRIAIMLIYGGEPRQALPFLEEAQKRGIHDQRLRPWLSGLEAEIHAMTGKTDQFLRALDRSKSVPLSMSLADDPYWTSFNLSHLQGFEGASWMHLHKPESALPALNEAFATHNPASIRRRSNVLVNLGTAHAQLGNVTKACELLLESLDLTAQRKSLVMLQRVYKGRAELDHWKDSADVKELDARIVEVYNTLSKVKERV